MNKLPDAMQLALHVPTKSVFEGRVLSVFAVAENGAFGLLPRHTDFLTALVPSVLILTDEQHRELFFGIDEGLLVKRDNSVDIAVRRGVQGSSLDSLQALVANTFVHVDEDERVARSALSHLEAGIVRRFGELRKPPK